MTATCLHSERVSFPAHDGDRGDAVYARPAGVGPFPGIVLVCAFPGDPAWAAQAADGCAELGYAVIVPDLFFRGGALPSGNQLTGDVAGATAFLHAQPSDGGMASVIGVCRPGAITAPHGPAGAHAVAAAIGGEVIVPDWDTARDGPVLLDWWEKRTP